MNAKGLPRTVHRAAYPTGKPHMLLAHLSDIHILDMKSARPWHFVGKRLTGAANLIMHRSGVHQNDVVEAALKHIEGLQCDHVVVTGDLTNLALDSEFEHAKGLLERFAKGPQRLSVIPGNHDRYTFGAAFSRVFEKHFDDYLSSDLPDLPRVAGIWPYVRLLDGVAIIGVSSAIALPPFVSGGRVGKRQRAFLKEALEHPEVQKRFSVVLQHHHLFTPVHSNFDKPRCLFDARQVRQTLSDGRANMALHGHNHLYGWHHIPYRNKAGGVLVCEAGSSSVSHSTNELRRGKFNVYDIQDGVLKGFQTYAYTDGEGFQLWRSWTIGELGPHEQFAA